MKKILFLSLTLFLISCGNEELPSEGEGFLSDIPTLSVQKTTVFDEEDSPVITPHSIVVTNGYAVVADGKTNMLHLFNPDEDHLHTAGGLGRGPGELTTINQMHIGNDGRLYVLDGMGKKVVVFRIEDDRLVHDRDILEPDYSPFNLKSVYVTGSGIIGVFSEVSPPIDQQDEFQVHRLSEELERQELLARLPGNESLVYERRKWDNPLGSTTFWKVVGNELFFLQSNAFTTSALNVADGSVREMAVFATHENEITPSQIEFIENRIPDVGGGYMPSRDDYIEHIETLPVVMDFHPTEEYIYYTLYNFSDEPGYLLVYDRVTGEIGKIQVPPVFNIYAVDENKIYGVDHSDTGHHKLMTVEHFSI